MSIPPGSSQSGESKSVLLYIPWLILVVAVLYLLLKVALIGVTQHVEHRAFSKITPEEKEQFERWYAEKVSIPPEMLQVGPFTSETQEAVHVLNRLWVESGSAVRDLSKAWGEQKKQQSAETSGTASTSRSLREWREKLEPFRPVLAAWLEVVKQPDYRMELWFLPQLDIGKDQMKTNTGLVRLTFVGNLISLDAQILLEEKRAEEALENADALLASAQTGPCRMIIQRGMAAALVNIGLDVYARLSDSGIDPALRKRAILSLEKYRKQGILGDVSELDLATVELIGMTLEARYQGIVPDFQNKTGWEIMEEWERVQQAYTGQCINPERIEATMEMMEFLDGRSQLLEELASDLKRIVPRKLYPELSEPKQAAEISMKSLNDQYRQIEKGPSGWKRTTSRKLHRTTVFGLYAILGALSDEPSKRDANFRQRYDRLLEDLKGK